MLRNYLKISFRHLLRNKSYTLINVFGLTLGVAVCIIIFLIINRDFHFDKVHQHYADIYRVVSTSSNASGKDFSPVSSYPLKDAIQAEIQEINHITRLHFEDENIVKIDNQDLIEEHDIIFTDTAFYDVLDFGGGIESNVLEGNFKTAMEQPGTIFLTEETAKRYFGEQNPIGKPLKLGNQLDCEVKGIIKNAPELSHLQYSMLVSYPTLTSDFIGGFDLDEYGVSISGFTYINIPQNRVEAINEQLKGVVKKYMSDGENSSHTKTLFLQPLSDIHFNMDFANGNITSTSNIKNIYTLAFIALFIISIACINFINLATALGIKRSREVGIRKVLGAGRKELIGQHLGESFLITLISLLLALATVERILPFFNQSFESSLTLNLTNNLNLLIFLGALLLIVSFLSGIYPAIVLSSYQPAKALKTKINSMSKSSVLFRKSLVIFQFGIAQALIIGAIVVSRQLSFFHDKPLGFEKDAIVDFYIPDTDSLKSEHFFNQVSELNNVENISFGLGAPSSENSISTSFSFPEVDENLEYDVSLKLCDYRYKDTYGLTLAAGKWFTKADDESADYKFVVNETLAKKIGFTNPEDAIGKELLTGINHIKAEIIGVTKDFHTKSLHHQIQPVLFLKFPQFYYNAGVKFSGGNLNSSIRNIENIWNEIYPGYIFEYHFLDEKINEFYKNEERIFNISQIFAGIAVFIGCLGLLGLSSFMVNQRKKEIGVRKVLGASNSSIVFLFSSSFLKLLIVAFFISAPISWFLMNSWLTDFPYRINIGIDVFIITIILACLAALATVSFQSIKAAFENPVKALKSE